MHKSISLFSGAMGFDLGLERAGLDIAVCVELEPHCVETIRSNRPQLPVIDRDIRRVPTDVILAKANLQPGEVFAVVGGPPCQSFSTGGKRASVMDPRGSLFMEFIRVIREAQPRFFIFENVGQLVTAAVKHRPIAERPGKNWNLSAYSKRNGRQAPSGPTLFESAEVATEESRPLEADELSGSAIRAVLEEFDKLGYAINLGVLNAANYGSPQRRMRLVILGSRDGLDIPLPAATHAETPAQPGRHPWRTLRDALAGLEDPNPLHSNYGPDFQAIFRLVPPGKNWRALPVEIQKQALGNAFESGGGKTGFFRRLSWDEPAPTIVGKPNRKSCAICHPDAIRPLTVRECARVQGFPDSWQLSGSMHDQYLQIGNAVPVELGEAVGRAVLTAERHQRPASPRDREAMLEAARQVLRQAARNRRATTPGQQDTEASDDGSLFED